MKKNRKKLVTVFLTICILASYCIGFTQVVVHALTNERAELSFQQEGKPISTLEFAPGETQVLTLVARNSVATKATVHLPNGVTYDATTSTQHNQGLANLTYDETTQQVQVEFLSESQKQAQLYLIGQENSEHELQELYATMSGEGQEYRSKAVQVNVVRTEDSESESTSRAQEPTMNSTTKEATAETTGTAFLSEQTNESINREEVSEPVKNEQDNSFDPLGTISPFATSNPNTMVVTKDNFEENFKFTGYGQARYDKATGVIKFTEDKNAQQTQSAVFNHRISNDESFELKGEVFLGTKTDKQGGGHGMSINLSTSPTGYSGTIGPALGIGGNLYNSFSFAMDTFYNTSKDWNRLDVDPTSNTNAANGQAETPYGAFITTNEIGQMSIDKNSVQYLDRSVFLNANSQFVPITVDYDGSTRMLTIKLNGQTWSKQVTHQKSFALTIAATTEFNAHNEQKFKFESLKFTRATRLKVTNKWEDNNDSEGVRPQKVKVNLLQDGKVLQTKEFLWNDTFDNLPVLRQDGTPYEYTVQEEPVANGYVVSYTYDRSKDPMEATLTHTLDNKPGTLTSKTSVFNQQNTDVANQVVQVGDPLTYVVEAQNTGATDTVIKNITIQDMLPAGVTYKENSAYLTIEDQRIDSATIQVVDGKLTANIGDLRGNQKAKLYFDVEVNKEAEQTITNTPTIDYYFPSTTGQIGNQGTAQTPSVSVKTATNVTLTKAVDKAQALVGDTLTYTITANNAVGSGKWKQTIQDQISKKLVALVPGTTTVNHNQVEDQTIWNDEKLALEQQLTSGEEVVITYQVTVLSTALNQTIENTATTTDNLTSNKVTTTILPGAGTLVTKNSVYDAQNQLVDKQTVRVGDILTYIIEAENTADTTTVINQVAIDDELPEGLAYLPDSAYVMIDEQKNDQAVINIAGQSIQTTIGTITGGQQIKLVLQATVTEEAKGQLINRAQVNYELPPVITRATGNTRLEQTPTSIVTVVDEMALTMAVDHTKALVGDTLTYTIIGENPTGSGKWEETINTLLTADEVKLIPGTTTINDQSVADDVVWANANELNYPVTLKSGQRLTIQFQVQVQESAWNQAVELTATATDGKMSDSVTTQIIPNAGVLESNKSVYDTTGQPITDQMMKVGDTIRYVIEATNMGDPFSVLNQLVIRDPLPEGITYQEGTAKLLIEGNPVENAEIIFENGVLSAKVGTLVGGQKASLQFETTINEEATGEITNIASIDYTVPKLPGDESMVETTKEPETPLTIAPDLSLEVSVSQSEAQIGEILTYTIRGRNITGGGKWQGEIIDKLPSQWLSLVPDTTKVNGEKRADTDVWQNAQELLLNQVLKSGEVVEIEFQAKILPDAVGQLIENTVRTNDGVMSNTATTKIVKKEANEVTTNTTQPSKQTDTSNKKTKNTQKNGQLPKTSENYSVGTSFIGLILVAMVSSYQLNRRKKA